MSCCVPFCPYKGIKSSTFSIPKNTSLKVEWERVLGTSLKESSRVCQNHFKHDDVINTWESGQGDNKYTVGHL